MSFTSIRARTCRTKAYSAVALPGCPFFVAAEYPTNIRPNAGRTQGVGADRSDKNAPQPIPQKMRTVAPIGTRGYISSTSSMFMRTQPCEACVPIDAESYVPWIRIPGAFR
jgi:hypothetical protein